MQIITVKITKVAKGRVTWDAEVAKGVLPDDDLIKDDILDQVASVLGLPQSKITLKFLIPTNVPTPKAGDLLTNVVRKPTNKGNIHTLITKANGGRKDRILPQHEIIALLKKVQAGESHAWGHGGGIFTYQILRRSGNKGKKTTIALAAWVDGSIHLGVKSCSAYLPSPGRAWKCLAPWNEGDMTLRLQKWVKEPDVIGF